MNFYKILGIFIINIAFLVNETNACDVYVRNHCNIVTNNGELVSFFVNTKFLNTIM